MEINAQLLSSSFLKVIPQRQKFSMIFYETLFSAYPHVRPLFAHTDMRLQQNKLFSVLSATVNNLNNPDTLKATLYELGRHHMSYNVKPEHFALVGDALLKTFAVVLGDAWTPELKQAWADGYLAISNLMQEAYQLTSPASH
jgi:hemoglobin-like flavoprotein